MQGNRVNFPTSTRPSTLKVLRIKERIPTSSSSSIILPLDLQFCVSRILRVHHVAYTNENLWETLIGTSTHLSLS
jgi:hypothetical protein